jgi:hypothetical protein
MRYDLQPAPPKAIETLYKGYRFRSRLEARWAVFFDASKIEWEYEVEGYELPSGRYLPDFWLPQVNMWAEVKAGDFLDAEIIKCGELSTATGFECLMLGGAPSGQMYWATESEFSEELRAKFDVDGFDCGWVEDAVSVGDRHFHASDHCLVEPHEYWLTRGNFYSGHGMPYPYKSEDDFGHCGEDAIRASRSARFEFGESG